MNDNEERLQRLLADKNGVNRVANTLEQVLYNRIPPFILQIKGKSECYRETFDASARILKEEMAKGNNDLYNRIRDRIDNYWESDYVIEE